MLDIDGRNTAAPVPPFAPEIQFVNVELALGADGLLFVGVQATIIDEDNLELLNQELANGRVHTLDEALALIRKGVTNTLRPATNPMEH
ncbi:MAG: hypothetical protein IT539_04455 [Bradyrhizobiaceae bacterium]|nr:hypothetical protein [Bradyrhizobiaceae bacterium]